MDRIFKSDLFSPRLKTSARASKYTGIIELDKIAFNEGYTPDFIFFIILWCVAINYNNDPFMADSLTTKYYLETGRSKKNLALGYIKLFSISPTPTNKKRYEKINNFITNFK